MEDCQVEVVNSSSGKIEQVNFGGEMVLSNQQQVKEKLAKMDFSDCDELLLSLSGLADLDLSFLQLLYSFKTKLEQLGVNVTIVWPEDEDLVNLVAKTGFSEIFNLK